MEALCVQEVGNEEAVTSREDLVRGGRISKRIQNKNWIEYRMRKEVVRRQRWDRG